MLMKIYVYHWIHKILKFYSFEVTKFKSSESLKIQRVLWFKEFRG